MSPRIVEAVGGKELRDFIGLQNALNRNDPTWVVRPGFERGSYFSRKGNPLFREKDVALFVAYEGDRAVGRISAQSEPGGGTEGQFGCFESIEDAGVTRALFAHAADWLKAGGATSMVGPFSLSINDECGVLVEGFDTPPVFLMPHNPAYYDGLCKGAGLEPAMDMLAYSFPLVPPFPPLAQKILQRVEKSGRIKLREVPPKAFGDEIQTIIEIFNDGWSGNWGFEPISVAAANHLASEVKPLLMRNMVWIADYDGQPAAVALSLPNLNEALAKLKPGAGIGAWLSVIKQVLTKSFKTARIPLFGLRKQFHGTSAAAELAVSILDVSRRGGLGHGMTWSEISWILETNAPMRAIIEDLFGASQYKRYRVYSKPVGT